MQGLVFLTGLAPFFGPCTSPLRWHGRPLNDGVSPLKMCSQRFVSKPRWQLCTHRTRWSHSIWWFLLVVINWPPSWLTASTSSRSNLGCWSCFTTIIGWSTIIKYFPLVKWIKPMVNQVFSTSKMNHYHGKCGGTKGFPLVYGKFKSKSISQPPHFPSIPWSPFLQAQVAAQGGRLLEATHSRPGSEAVQGFNHQWD